MKSDFKNIKRIVIKVGSSLLVEDGALREKWLEKFAADISELIEAKIETVIVSSGAIALGRAVLNKKDKLI